MDIISASIYGLIQGITEFLPVSSSGHLALLPKFMNIKDPGVTFDLFMHIGTAFAVMLYFYKDLAREIKHIIPAAINWKDTRVEYVFFRNLLVSMFATFVIVLLIKNIAEEYGRSTYFIAINLAFFGILMYWFDKKADKTSADLEVKFSIKNALIIGFAQGIAVFPGVSRSGITITAARFLGVSREQALRYSFLLSLPVIFAGAAFKFIELNGEHFSWSACFLGVLFSFVIGLMSIHFLMKIITRVGFAPFAIYRVILAIILLML